MFLLPPLARGCTLLERLARGPAPRRAPGGRGWRDEAHRGPPRAGGGARAKRRRRRPGPPAAEAGGGERRRREEEKNWDQAPADADRQETCRRGRAGRGAWLARRAQPGPATPPNPRERGGARITGALPLRPRAPPALPRHDRVVKNSG
ncbi:unnamed protein product [Prorocentrum cordatum]|uniref:Uncharacterized protein n=1 Tax=Prorocentrum cordatum TaxID=2364126 RepID=A0ABN9RZA6_9DINO|nr:unnamed protein product [Polarella glacialis]